MKSNRVFRLFLTSVILTSIAFFAPNVVAAEPTRYEYSAEKMGVPVRIVLYCDDEQKADAAANAVWERFDELNSKLSDYDPESEITRVCRESGDTGEYVAVGDDLRRSLEESRRYCELTDGAFDATVGPIVKLWRRSRYFHERPPENVLEPAKKRVGLNVWTLDEKGIKTEMGVRFDVGGIAKGVALDEALATLKRFGIDSALVDASGDLRIGDPPPGKDGWNVGISSLSDKPACFCSLANVGVASSGDANRYVEIDGVRYSHIIDPRSCEPLTRRCVGTVLAPTATTADALASALCVLGGEDAPKIFERVRLTSVTPGTDKTEPLEYLLYQLESDAEPPYTEDKVKLYATPFFQNELREEAPMK